MKHPARLLVLLMLCCPPSLLAAAERGDADAARAAVLARFDAALHADTKTLERLLADDLDYCNFQGECDTKAAYIGEVKSGALKYKSIQGEVDEVKLFADTAAVRGRVFATATRGGVERSIRATYLAVLAWRDGRWQLTNWHTTLLDLKQNPSP
jgi:Domain of unknown function (DUF4440)